MNAAHYNIEALSPYGKHLFSFDRFESLETARKINEVGVAHLKFFSEFRLDRIRRYLYDDVMLFIWRNLAGRSYLVGKTPWFVRDVKLRMSAKEGYWIEVKAFDANHLLDRRIVAYPAGSPQTDKRGPADEIIKEIVNEQLGLGAIEERRITGLRIDRNRSAAAIVEKQFAWQQLLSTIQKLASDATAQGTWLCFEVERQGSEFILRTFTGQRGRDRRLGKSASPLLLDESNYSEAERHWSDGVTCIYAGGRGQGSERIIAEVSDRKRILLSPFGRFERFKHASHATTDTALQAEASSELADRRGKELFKAQFQESSNARYGIDIGYGDFVTAKFAGEYFDCRLTAEHITVDKNGETLDIRLESEK